MTTAIKEKPQVQQTETEFTLPAEWQNDQDYQNAQNMFEDTNQRIRELQETVSSSEARLNELKTEIDEKELLLELGRIDVSELKKLQVEQSDLEKSRKKARAQLIVENENLAKHKKQLKIATERTQIITMVAILETDIKEIEAQCSAGQLFFDKQTNRITLLKFASVQFDTHAGVSPDRNKAGLRDHFLYASEGHAHEQKNWVKMQDEVLAFYRARVESLQNELNNLKEAE